MDSTRVAATVSVLAIVLLPAGAAIGSTTQSAKGGLLAFVKTPEYELWVSGTDGRRPKALSSGNGGLSDLAWSPDGRRIAFLGSSRLQVVNANGSGLRRLTESTVAIGIAWSPDGRRIAYTGFDEGRPRLYVVSAGGGPPRSLTPTFVAAVSPSWSPRGATIAFATAHVDGGPIYGVEADGSRLRKLTDGRDDSFPSWSPDGRLLAFQRYTCPSASTCGYGLHVMRANGSMPRHLIHVPRHPGDGTLGAAWSPDSRRIAFTRARDGLLRDEIVVIDANGKNVRSLTRNDRAGGNDPAWSPDGRTIAYESSSIYAMNSDGSGKRLLVKSARLPAWQPRR